MKMKLGTVVYLHETFHLTKIFGRGTKTVGGRGPKTSKKTPKIGFFGPVTRIFNNKSKPVTYVILYLALHHLWKFCANRNWFGVVMHEKPPKSSPKCPFLLVRETLKVYNLTTTNPMKTKLGTIVYLDENFHLVEKIFAPHSGRGLKTSLKSLKSWFLGLFPWNFQNYFKNRNICDVK